jgi:hypothetical protein
MYPDDDDPMIRISNTLFKFKAYELKCYELFDLNMSHMFNSTNKNPNHIHISHKERLYTTQNRTFIY